MSDEEELPTAPAERPEIVDPHNVPPLFVDWIVTGGLFEGVVNVTLGTIDHSLKKSNDELAQVMISARLRCSREFAERLHMALGDILGVHRPPEDGPPRPITPPKNTLN